MKSLLKVGFGVTLSAITLAATAHLSFASGGDASGGTYLVGDLPLDLLEDGEQKQPLEVFQDVRAHHMAPVLDKLRASLPDLADDIEQVFIEKPWFFVKKELHAGDANPDIVTDKISTAVSQQPGFVRYGNKFLNLPKDRQALSLIHEGVRNLAIRLGLKKTEKEIRYVTMLVMNSEKFSEGELQGMVKKAGFGHYLTASKRAEAEGLVQSFDELMCHALRPVLKKYEGDLASYFTEGDIRFGDRGFDLRYEAGEALEADPTYMKNRREIMRIAGDLSSFLNKHSQSGEKHPTAYFPTIKKRYAGFRYRDVSWMPYLADQLNLVERFSTPFILKNSETVAGGAAFNICSTIPEGGKWFSTVQGIFRPLSFNGHTTFGDLSSVMSVNRTISSIGPKVETTQKVFGGRKPTKNQPIAQPGSKSEQESNSRQAK